MAVVPASSIFGYGSDAFNVSFWVVVFCFSVWRRFFRSGPRNFSAFQKRFEKYEFILDPRVADEAKNNTHADEATMGNTRMKIEICEGWAVRWT